MLVSSPFARSKAQKVNALTKRLPFEAARLGVIELVQQKTTGESAERSNAMDSCRRAGEADQLLGSRLARPEVGHRGFEPRGCAQGPAVNELTVAPTGIESSLLRPSAESSFCETPAPPPYCAVHFATLNRRRGFQPAQKRRLRDALARLRGVCAGAPLASTRKSWSSTT
jgi:hypothetical protein